MKRSIFKSWYLATVIFAVPAQALAVWPPSTSLAVESEVSSTGAQGQSMTPELHQNVQAATNKLEEDQRRLERVIQDLKDDEAALKKLSAGRLADVQGGPHS